MRSTRRQNQKGNTIIEFALVSMLLIPLMLGTVNVGMNLSRSIQVTQVSRDAGHMYVRFVDFSLDGNKDIIVRLAHGLGMTRDGGNGTVLLSKILFVGELECEAGGLTVEQCPNFNYPVITQRQTIGNTSLQSSAIGEPDANLLDAEGNVANYLTEASARSDTFNNILPLESGEFAYVSEAAFASPEYDFPGFFENTSSYARTIF
ncbi:MAG: pilus assembly protein [bacterium]|nr:pilus assembly protein [bacterium]